jgi:ribosome assembly protein 1
VINVSRINRLSDNPIVEGSAHSEVFSSRDFEDKILHAFQLSTYQGPLCNEPVQGIACFVEDTTATPSAGMDLDVSRIRDFEVISAVQNAIRQGFLDWSPRLMLAMYSCDIQASSMSFCTLHFQFHVNSMLISTVADVLGRVHDTIAIRGGRTIAELQEEGTPFWTIKALIPVAESFGFADEIRKRTSGAASPQLVFCGYQILDEDPFWIPSTELELEDLGDVADRENVAKRYMDAIRTRKGLFVLKRLVVGAEKQKTLKR